MEIENAQDFLRNRVHITQDGDPEDVHASLLSVADAMIEFTKMHVQAALNEVHNSAYVEFIDEQGEPFDYTDVLADQGDSAQVNPSSILNAYPLDNIK